MRRTLAAGVVAGFVVAAGFAAPAQAISETTADLYVLHAIPATPVDVYVNGTLTLDDFQPGTLAGPLDLPAGDYAVALTAPDAADDSAPVLGPATITLTAGTSYTATANLDDAGAPALNLFTNDIATTSAGEGRLTVRHVAAAPAVDVLAGGAPVVEDLANPDEATLNLPVGTVAASVALAGTTDPVIGPADVAIEDGKLTIVYAWGSAEEGTLALATQSITVGHSTPGGVNSGTAGYAAERDALMQASWIFGGAVIAIGLLAALVIRRRAHIES
ncbi:hypothetical protein ASD56_06130 [Microbacterium sp. Root166]|uniref:DUF4397 domain-containing protein n=1 Tax=Microbacterium sp. Root166 TaxID=1736478 RepID=UPI0006FC6C2B|nr:DUF4397 domain-containing protein [Microbacterium sp. Root166]KQZ85856.1 hypothetical protein ASD56_06130 [Microbacterium sp. Root166]